MDIVKKYGRALTEKISNDPAAALKMILFGLQADIVRLKCLPNRKLPKAYRALRIMSTASVLSALRSPDKSVWVNIFTPTEILQCFGLHPISVESFSGFMTAFKIENYLIKKAEKSGIAETLCSFHKGFLGAVETALLPPPLLSVTTTFACDGNVNTFHYAHAKQGIETYILDIPYDDSPDSITYVVSQLRDFISILEQKTGKRFEEEALMEILRREERCREYMQSCWKQQLSRHYPTTLRLQMLKLFPTHILAGSEEALHFYKLMAEDSDTFPVSGGLKVYWPFLQPFDQETLNRLFDFSRTHLIYTRDLDMDFPGNLEPDRPLETLARKMIRNIYNGPYERRVKAITETIDELDADAVIHFCHWGCKQSCGGVMQLKEVMRQKNLPMLILDGDCMDHENNQDGQIKTRVEAFLEMVEKQKGKSLA